MEFRQRLSRRMGTTCMAACLLAVCGVATVRADSVPSKDVPKKTEVHPYGDERIEVIYRKTKPSGENLNPGATVEDGIRIERDVAVPMRDGTILYADIYRPEDSGKVPAIVAWSPYGKRVDRTRVPPVMAAAVPPSVSSMAKFEGPDPAYWCRHGYAVINPDPRGVGHSQGDIYFLGSGEGRDGYDLVEWVAARDWSNGKVGMSGNSYLAIAQWFIAAERPPHLAAIAPWEGASDLYRQRIAVGGIPGPTTFEMYYAIALNGPGYAEDIPAMIRKYPLMNGFWEDRIARLENIDIPAYITANWKHYHVLGSLDGFRKIASKEKWMRVINTFEWPDYYAPGNLEDLLRFFDRYLKGIRNGWETTPRVRLSVLDPGGVDQVNRSEKEFPLARTRYEKLFLDAATGTLSPEAARRESVSRYRSEDRKGQAAFTIRFTEDTELTGYLKLHLWVEADGADDMDLFVYVQKLDREGNFLPSMVLGQPHPGAQGWLRVSHRELDEDRSTPSEPFLTHRREQPLNPREIVPVEIGIWPTGMLWHAGEQLRVVVSGQVQRDPRWFENLDFDLRNRGDHVLHTGGKFDSYLLVPKIPR